MKSKSSKSRLQTINYLRPAVIAISVLIIPLVAMQFVEGFNWGPGDFVGMGIFIYIFGLLFEAAMIKLPKHRKIAGVLILAVFITLYGLMATTD